MAPPAAPCWPRWGRVSLAATDWILLLPELLLTAGVLLVALVARTHKDRWVLSLVLVLAAMAAVIWMILPDGLLARYGITEPTAFGFFEVTPYALAFKLVFLAVSLLVLLGSADYLRDAKETSEYYALLLTATIGMMVVASARDLITLFLGLETSSIATFVLVGYRKTSLESNEASMKFFVIGALSASLTLFGISLVYAIAGTVDLYELAAFGAAGFEGPLLLAVAFLVAGFGFKVTSVPFHMWAADVYHGSPDPVSALVAGASKKMGFAAFLKVFFVALLAVKLQWDVLVGILALLTMTLANLVALQQTSLKRLIAWSSIAHAGYILIAFPVGTAFAITGAFFHIFTHAVTAGGAFLILAALGGRGVGESIDSVRGLARRQPLIGFTLALIMLSLAGVPPLAGFASKFVLFGSAIQAGLDRSNPWLIWLAVAAILNSAVSLFYYARVVRVAYADEPGEPLVPLRIPGSVTLGFLIVFLATLVMGIWPQPFLELGRMAADSLLSSAAP